MSFLLSELLENVELSGELAGLRVTGVSADTRALGMEQAFFALPGSQVHGNAFAEKAAEHGARVIITDAEIDPAPEVPTIVVEDVRRQFALASMKVQRDGPSTIAGITGTNGKTSIASFVRQIWEKCGHKSASIGTLGVQVGEAIEQGSLTTPDPLSLAKSLSALKAEGCDHVVIETSSHGLDQRRLDGVSFDVAAFSNLSRDHLDYHADMDEYRDAKLRLFKDLLKDGGSAVVNADDPEHMPFMFAALDRGATLLTVGREGAFIQIEEITPVGQGQKVVGKLVGEPLEFTLPLAGEFQVSNAVVAAAIVLSQGAHADDVVPALNALVGAKGRLEKIGSKDGAAIYVDYAHTPDSLTAALAALRPFAKGKLHVVFGAGGDRDQGKRELMGEAAKDGADSIIVTDDNPRSEDAASIRNAVMAGCPDAQEIGDRKEAIETAIAALGDGDVLLIAGKGHEDYQIIGSTKHAFSDEAVALAALRG